MRFQSIVLAASLIGALWLPPGAVSPASASTHAALSDQLRQRLEAQRAGVPLTADGRPLQAVEAVQNFYARRLYEPAWFGDGRLLGPARAIVPLLASARQDGLRPEDYAYAELEHAVNAHDGGQLDPAPVELELALTDAVLAYASDMLRGRVQPETLFSTWESAPRELDLTLYLQEALDAGRLVWSLRNLAPAHPHYNRLRGLLSQFRRIDLEGGLVTVPPGEALKPGMRAGRVAVLRRRLAQSGDLGDTDSSSDPELFDAGLEAAVKRYQARHGLEADGVVGAGTIESLGVPAARRIRAIELNMERWRWLPQDLGDRYITVNIAGFQMQLVERGAVQLAMPAVVGQRYHATPVFTGSMTYLVFSPYWHVPPGIAVRQILPRIKDDPSYLDQESIKVFRGWEQPADPLDPAAIDWSSVSATNFPYRFRQDPGPRNALGGVKFMFPNKYHVYLHDTPAKALFSRAARDFSNGCIRLARPLELAEYLLSDQENWDAQRIAAAAGRGVEQTVRLTRAWPVHLLYWTVWVEQDGDVHFRPDVYGRDERLAEALYN